MTHQIRSNADRSAQPAVEVRDNEGLLLRRIADGQADQLVALRWGEWIGAGRRRYVRLTSAAPVSAFAFWRGRDGTRPARGQSDQFLGDPKKIREFRPVTPEKA